MENQKRKARAYKILDDAYNQAKNRKSNTPLATIVESFVTEYGKKNPKVDKLVTELQKLPKQAGK